MKAERICFSGDLGTLNAPAGKHFADLSLPENVRGRAIKEALERDGYAVERNVFSAAEVAGMRGEAAMLIAKARPLGGGLGVCPMPREADLACRLLNDVRLASHCGGELPVEVYLHADTVNDWHRDFGPPASNLLREAPAWMYKIAIFLQDHSGRDGLSVLPGSHKEGSTARVPLHIDTRAGDIIVFDQRIRHAGRLPNRAERLILNITLALHRLRLVDDASRQRLYRLFRRLEQFLRPAAADERVAIFAFYSPYLNLRGKYAALRARHLEPLAVSGSGSPIASKPPSGALWNGYRYLTSVLRTIYYAVEGPPPTDGKEGRPRAIACPQGFAPGFGEHPEAMKR